MAKMPRARRPEWSLLALFALPGGIGGQVPDTIEVAGRVTRALSEGPAVGFGVQVVEGPGATTDSSGAFALSVVTTTDQVSLLVVCPANRSIFGWGKSVGPFTFPRQAAQGITLDVGTDCFEPEEEERPGVFAGHYSVGLRAKQMDAMRIVA